MKSGALVNWMIGAACAVGLGLLIWGEVKPDSPPPPSREELQERIEHLNMRVLRLEQKLVERSGALIGDLTISAYSKGGKD